MVQAEGERRPFAVGWVFEDEAFLCALVADTGRGAIVANELYGRRAVDHAARHLASGFLGARTCHPDCSE